MKYLKIFESFLKELEFYTLYGELVYINDINTFGNQIEVKYITSNNVTRTYIADSWSEIEEDFIPTKDSFELKFSEVGNIKNNQKDVSKAKKPTHFDIVYYVGNKKVETIKYNVTSKDAYPLKNYFSKMPKYKMGVVKLIPNK